MVVRPRSRWYGDDAAVFLVNGSAVTSTDMLVEGVEFRRDWSSAAEVGRKSVAVNVADLEAMGAKPVAMVIGFGIPADLPAEWVREFAKGFGPRPTWRVSPWSVATSPRLTRSPSG